MSTVIDLPVEMENSLDQRSREEQVSREELIRRAIDAYLTCPLPSFQPQPAREPGPWPELDAVVGTWKQGDGLQYQQRIREEWDK